MCPTSAQQPLTFTTQSNGSSRSYSTGFVGFCLSTCDYETLFLPNTHQSASCFHCGSSRRNDTVVFEHLWSNACDHYSHNHTPTPRTSLKYRYNRSSSGRRSAQVMWGFFSRAPVIIWPSLLHNQRTTSNLYWHSNSCINSSNSSRSAAGKATADVTTQVM